jgi:hypothetical protein
MGLFGAISFVPLFVQGAYQDLPDMLRRGQIDLIMAGYVPDPSLEGLEWSDSYLEFGLCLIVLRSSAFTELSQLAGKTIAIYEDPAAENWVKKNIPGARVKAFSGDSGWFEPRAAPSGRPDLMPLCRRGDQGHPHQIVQFNLNQSHYAVGCRQRRPARCGQQRHHPDQVSSGYGDLVRQYLSYKSEDVVKPVAGRKTYGAAGETPAPSPRSARLVRSLEIWQINRERIANPHLIYPDYVLIMP